MRGAALLGFLLLSGGCYTIRSPLQTPPPSVGVLVQGVTSRCAPVLVGSVVRRVCLPPPDTGSAKPDTAASDTVVTR